MAISATNNYAAYTGCNLDTKNAPQSAQATGNRQKTEKSSASPQEYKQYLTEKYDCLKSRDYTVAINPAFLNKAAGDEEKAAWLEENLALIPEIVENTRAKIEAGGGKMLSCGITIDGYDSMTMIVCAQSEAATGTEKAGETWLYKLQKQTTEKAAEKRAEKRQEDAEQIKRLIAKGSGIKEISGKMLAGQKGFALGNRLDITA